MSAYKMIVVMGVLLIGAAGPAASKKLTIPIPTSSVTTHTPAQNDSLGPYFLLQFELPNEVLGKTLDAALLEFYLDVVSYERKEELYANAGPEAPNAYVNETPMIEVFAPTGTFTGTLGTNTLDMSSRAALPVLAGEDRRVVLDITEVIQALLDGNARNYGLVVGSITGMREGSFSLKSGNFDAEVAARIRLYLAPVD